MIGALLLQSVLLIIGDDIGRTEIGSMPSVQALAAQGVSFTRAYSWPMCSPSRYAMLFGRYPRRVSGFGGNEPNPHDPAALRFPLEARSLPERLSLPSLLVGKWHLGRAPLFGEMDLTQSAPTSQGFDHWLAGCPVTPAFAGSTGYRDWWRVDDGVMVRETRYATDAQRDEFLAWWTATAGPKLGVLSWSAAHSTAAGMWDPVPGYTTAQWNALSTRRKYEVTIEYMDAQLAVVLSQVDLGTTFVMWVGDNGAENIARPTGTPFNHWKFTTWEGGIGVPVVVAGPGVGQGVSTDRLVSLVDVPATLCELAGVAASWEDSLSFADGLGAWTGSPARSWVFSERFASNYDDVAVIEHAWKLRRVDPDGPAGPSPQTNTYMTAADVLLQPSQCIKDRLLAELASLPPRAP